VCGPLAAVAWAWLTLCVLHAALRDAVACVGRGRWHNIPWRRNMLYNNMNGSLPEALGDLKQLTELQMGHNQVKGSIPETLGDLKQLAFLSLDDNRLTGVVPSLPFKNYTGGCYLRLPTSPSNHYTCPLPPVSPSRVHAILTCLSCRRPAPPRPTRAHTNARAQPCPSRAHVRTHIARLVSPLPPLANSPAAAC
jgi:hypothetical protein